MEVLNYGQRNGLVILVAQRMGYDVCFLEEANTLFKGSEIDSIYMGIVDTEASRVSNLIAEDARALEGNNLAKEILNGN